MSDLFHTPGTADGIGESLSHHHEAQILFEAEVAYFRGNIDKIYESANYLLSKHAGFYAILSAGMLHQKIANMLNLSLPLVKQAIRIVMEKSGLPRSDFAAIL